MAEFLAEIFFQLIGMGLLAVPGSGMRWWFSGRKRPWKEFFLDDDSAKNIRMGLLFWGTLAALGAGGYLLFR